MTYTIDRFEDDDLAVLETEAGEAVVVPRTHVPLEAREGDGLVELNGGPVDGDVRYAVDFEATGRRRQKAADLRAPLPTAMVGDHEL